MVPCHILIVIISSVIPENLVLLTKSEQSGPKSAHIRPTIMPTSKQKYQCFLMLVQNFSACTPRIYSLIVSDTNFHQFGHTFSFEMAQTRSQNKTAAKRNNIQQQQEAKSVRRQTAVSQRNLFWRVVTGTLHWLASLHCLLYFLAFDWRRPAVLFFLNWTVCLFVKESPIWNYPD